MNKKQCIPDLKAEAILNPNISFDNPLSKNIDNPKSIFLTGATGFLGAYLLKEILEKTTADIYCLVRCSGVENGKERLKKHLQFYQIWQEFFDSRIIIIVGDLSQTHLGLSEEQFYKLADQIDVIYHNASQVESLSSYSQMRGVNVLGTQEILHLAGLIQTKPIHFISTIAIFFGQDNSGIKQFKETDFPLVNASLNTSYKQSKWVAEELIHLAQKRGLPASIYRPTRIMGDRKTGIYSKANNFFFEFIKTCIELGNFPDFDVDLNIIPVDYASEAIIYLSRQKQLLGKTFHLVNPESISWKKFFELINICGYLSKEIPYQEWLFTVENYIFDCGGEKAVTSLLLNLSNSARVISLTKPHFDACQTIQGLEDTSIVCHPMDLSLISTYLSSWDLSLKSAEKGDRLVNI